MLRAPHLLLLTAAASVIMSTGGVAVAQSPDAPGPGAERASAAAAKPLASLDITTSNEEKALLHRRAEEFVSAARLGSGRLRSLGTEELGAELVSQVVRCLDLDGAFYCLGLGFRERPVTYSDLRGLVGEGSSGSGDLSLAEWASQRLAMDPAERARRELAELDDAIAGAAKARAVNSGRVTAAAAAKRAGTARTPNCIPDDNGGCINPSYPSSFKIMEGYQTRQVKSYYCGPATMQMIDWADDRQQDTQDSWASDLGTTTSGTAITSMVQQVNQKTTWDVAAGSYIVQSVANWTPDYFMDIHMRHFGDGTPAPIVEHPLESSTYFTWLHSTYSGHYMVGRGYDSARGLIHVFDPYNEDDWSSANNYTTWGPHSVNYEALLRATKANSTFKNIGM